jgi:hypothetical protein
MILGHNIGIPLQNATDSFKGLPSGEGSFGLRSMNPFGQYAARLAESVVRSRNNQPVRANDFGTFMDYAEKVRDKVRRREYNRGEMLVAKSFLQNSKWLAQIAGLRKSRSSNDDKYPEGVWVSDRPVMAATVRHLPVLSRFWSEWADLLEQDVDPALRTIEHIAGVNFVHFTDIEVRDMALDMAAKDFDYEYKNDMRQIDLDEMKIPSLKDIIKGETGK